MARMKYTTTTIDSIIHVYTQISNTVDYQGEVTPVAWAILTLAVVLATAGKRGRPTTNPS